MERIEQEHGYYTTLDWKYHSFDDEPAVVVESHTITNENWEEEQIDWYKARYNNWEWIKTERDCWETFTNNEI